MTDETQAPVEARPKNELIRAALGGDDVARRHLEQHADEITRLMAKA